NPRMPSSVRAQTTATSAIEPLVIQSLVPSSTHVPAEVRRAVVRIPPGSLPWSGSVRPKHPTASPVAMRGSQACFCSSEPYRERALDGHEAAQPTVDGLELEAGQAVRHGAGARAAVARQRHPEQSHPAELRYQLDREPALGEPPTGERHRLLGEEGSNSLLDV